MKGIIFPVLSVVLACSAAGQARADNSQSQDATSPVVTIQHLAADAPSATPFVPVGHMNPVMDQGTYFHGILNEMEGRYSASGTDFRWDGESWYGSDYNKLWLKSEGTLERGRLQDGQQELLYSRSVSTYFDVQAGVRLDLDDGPMRTWGAFGVQGLALYQFEVQATAYVSDEGRFAAKVEGSYDFLLTNRLILQPQAEFNFYTKSDAARQSGAGLSDVDAGLRLRYEIWRKFAPYIAVTYSGYLTQARRIVHDQGGKTGTTRFTLGIRSWF
ncbi:MULTISPECIES: copper resistance protein B [Acetobacter]|uniref:copper resistance protein B n=1 Tax=Acetobacter TaxID=434 RepID=UPI000A3C9777|nr:MULTISPECIES: copper resistance protein B [Acetobacter]MBS0980811.1 copper resistance protein B [Acetobacter thailandicus]MBS0984951.1 copper resistance protein B [Acetobacter thailandicus]OUJ11680.1 copper resistance protein CopB [Acetobacter sp. DsW_059]